MNKYLLLPLVASAGLAVAQHSPVSENARSAFWWGDYDADGLQDALVLGSGAPRLLHNLGDGQFEDTTERTGLARALAAGSAHMALWADYDADGRLDVYLPSLDGPSHLVRQSADGVFEVTTDASGIPADARPLVAEWLDFDGDRRPDLRIATGQREQLFHNAGKGLFEAVRLGEVDLPVSGLTTAAADLRRAAGDAEATPESGDAPAASRSASAGNRRPAPPSGDDDPGSAPSNLGIDDFALICARTVLDQATGDCVTISSLPTMGSLLPLGTEFFVDPGGYVGIGTMAPGAQLDVVGGNVRTDGQLVSTAASGPPLAVSSTTMVPNLNADRLDGLHASSFSQLGNSIESSEITNGQVANADLANDSVSAAKIVAGAVGTSEIANSSITASDLANLAVTNAKIANSSVNSTKLGSFAVINSKLGTNSVTTDKIASSAVTNTDLANNAVNSAKIQDGTVTAADLASNSVGSAEIINNTIEYYDLASPMERNGVGCVLRLKNLTTGTQGDGVCAETASFNGVALEGLATSTTTGVTYGVKGLSAAGAGIGVWGRSNSLSGSSFGVKGENYSSSGAAVRGQNYSTTGTAIGVSATTPSNTGRAMFAEATSLTGSTYGVYAESDSGTNGIGVYGRSSSTSGTGQGVRGWTNSSTGYGVYSSGDFGGNGAKYFISPHPQDASKQINFVCLEGNESGTYFRGTSRIVGGMAVIDVPEDFRLVSEPDQLTVQVTPIGAPAGVWIESKGLDRIVVRGSSDVEFDYFVNGIRRGFEGIETIRENMSFVPELRGVPFGNQFRPEYRQLLVENGILNPDFTPNEATAAAMGWVLRDPEVAEQEQAPR